MDTVAKGIFATKIIVAGRPVFWQMQRENLFPIRTDRFPEEDKLGTGLGASDTGEFRACGCRMGLSGEGR